MLSKFFEILVLLLSILLYNGKEEIWRTADKLGNLYESEAQTDRRYIGSQLQHDGKWWYYYDNEGNLILKSPYQRHGKSPDTSWQSGSWAYEWNANGSLKSVKRADGKEAAKQAALGFLKSAPRSVMHNLSQGISGDWVMKGIDASQQWLTAYGESGEGSLEDFAGYLRDSSFSEVNALKNIATGQGGTADWLAAGMLLIPGSTPNKSNKPNHAMGIVDEVSPKKPKVNTASKTKPKKKPDGGAFEEGVGISNKAKGTIAENSVKAKLEAEGYEVKTIQNRSGHGVDIIARHPETGHVKCIEVKSNNSTLSKHQQKGGEDFVDSRLKRATSNRGHYKVPPNTEKMKRDAEIAQKWIENGKAINNIDYEVYRVEVDNVTGEVIGEPKISTWNPQ